MDDNDGYFKGFKDFRLYYQRWLPAARRGRCCLWHTGLLSTADATVTSSTTSSRGAIRIRSGPPGTWEIGWRPCPGGKLL